MNDNELTKEQLETLKNFLSRLSYLDLDYLIQKNQIENVKADDFVKIINNLLRMFNEL